MIAKKTFFSLLFLTIFTLQASEGSDTSLFSSSDDPRHDSALVASQEPLQPPVILPVVPGAQPLAVPHAHHAPSLGSALYTVSAHVCAAIAVLGNTFGRLAIAGYLGHKGYLYAMKAWYGETTQRNKHALKALCYCGAACMLLQDGYAWVLRQDVRE